MPTQHHHPGGPQLSCRPDIALETSPNVHFACKRQLTTTLLASHSDNEGVLGKAVTRPLAAALRYKKLAHGYPPYLIVDSWPLKKPILRG